MELSLYLDKINDMMTHAHKNVVCGTECKRKKRKRIEKNI